MKHELSCRRAEVLVVKWNIQAILRHEQGCHERSMLCSGSGSSGSEHKTRKGPGVGAVKASGQACIEKLSEGAALWHVGLMVNWSGGLGSGV